MNKSSVSRFYVILTQTFYLFVLIEDQHYFLSRIHFISTFKILSLIVYECLFPYIIALKVFICPLFILHQLQPHMH